MSITYNTPEFESHDSQLLLRCFKKLFGTSTLSKPQSLGNEYIFSPKQEN